MTTATKHLPILFNGEMVRAVLAGTKTVTRRPIKPQPRMGSFADFDAKAEGYTLSELMTAAWEDGDVPVKCPHGEPETLLYVRETWAADSVVDDLPPSDMSAPDDMALWYRADGDARPRPTRDPTEPGKWRPSIHMPKWAARIWLEVVSVRVERLKEITWEGAFAEGAGGPDGRCGAVALENLPGLWDSIYAAKGLGWEANPWVWVTEFKKVEVPS